MDRDSSHRSPAVLSGAGSLHANEAPAAPPESELDDAAPQTAEAEASTPSRTETPAQKPRSAPAALRIGVFEDSYSTLRLVMSAFKERGHQVDHLASLEDATDALQAGVYDVLIVSDTMIGGAEACQSVIARIRSGPNRVMAAIPILALTLRGDASRRRVLELLGASATVSEPNETRLVGALSEALDHDEPPASARGQPRVLLLEDSYSLSLLLSDGLLRGGRAVDHFATADQAISALEKGDYEALVLSQNDQPGQVACEQLIEYAYLLGQERAVKPRIIVLTDDLTPENANSLLRAGAERVLQKRNPAQLGSFILNLLEIKHTAHGGEPHGVNLPPATARERAAKPNDSRVPLSPPYVAVLGIAIALAFGWIGWQVFAVKPLVNVASAEVDTVARVLPASGSVISKRQVELVPASTGQLFHVYAGEGDLVRKGETLATLDNREATINVRRAEAQVFRYKTELNLANKTLKALRGQAGAEVSQQVLLDLEKERALAAAKFKIAEQDLSASKLALDRFSIIAPFAGVLLQSFAVEGKWVEAGIPVFTLSDLDSREVVLRLEAGAAREVAPGQTVQLSADGALGEEWEEKVLRVVDESRAGETAPKGAGALVYVSLGEDAPLLQFGRRVNAQIITDAVGNAVTIPIEALLQRNDEFYVALVENERVNFRPVQVGLRSLNKAEIRGGLVPGDAVILSAASLTNGQRVDVSAGVSLVTGMSSNVSVDKFAEK